MKMDKVLMGKEIPVSVLRNNYINGVNKYNYEKFMIDFINNSKLVNEKGASFCYQEEQSNSEADASNGFYDIDFKILCEPEQMHARISTGMRIFKTQEGNIAYSLAPKNKQEMGFYNMMNVFIKWPLILTDGYKIDDDKSGLLAIFSC